MAKPACQRQAARVQVRPTVARARSVVPAVQTAAGAHRRVGPATRVRTTAEFQAARRAEARQVTEVLVAPRRVQGVRAAAPEALVKRGATAVREQARERLDVREQGADPVARTTTARGSSAATAVARTTRTIFRTAVAAGTSARARRLTAAEHSALRARARPLAPTRRRVAAACAAVPAKSAARERWGAAPVRRASIPRRKASALEAASSAGAPIQ